MEDGHQEHVEEGWRDLKEFLANNTSSDNWDSTAMNEVNRGNSETHKVSDKQVFRSFTLLKSVF